MKVLIQVVAWIIIWGAPIAGFSQDSSYVRAGFTLAPELVGKVEFKFKDADSGAVIIYANGDSVAIKQGYFDIAHDLEVVVQDTHILFGKVNGRLLCDSRLQIELSNRICYCPVKAKVRRSVEAMVVICFSNGDCFDICMLPKVVMPFAQENPTNN